MKEPTKKLTQMRLDLEDYDFKIELIKGKDNVGADAVLRIVTSHDLKNNSILMVNTRSMTSKNTNVTKDTISTEKKPDQLLVSEIDILKEARNSLKLVSEVQNDIFKFKIKSANYKKKNKSYLLK